MKKTLGQNELNEYLYRIGNNDFDSWIISLKETLSKSSLDLSRLSAIVFNANPFTNGHRYLAELASKRSSAVLIFVIQGKSESSSKGNHENTGIEYEFEKRLFMTKNALSDLKNVIVIPSGPFIISRDDFPKEYLKEEMSNASAHAILDSMVFCKVCSKLDIKYAFSGDEPRDELSEIHLNALREQCLKNNIILRVAERKRLGDRYISSSLVRQELSNKSFDIIKNLVPESVFNTILSLN